MASPSMSGGKNKPKVGDRLRVWWWDYVNHTTALLSDAKPARCWTDGRLMRETGENIVLASSLYVDENGEPEGKDICGDYTVIIRGGIEKIEQLK